MRIGVAQYLKQLASFAGALGGHPCTQVGLGSRRPDSGELY